MSEWLIPLISVLLATAGGIYATRAKRSTERGDLADRLVNQLQEERDTAAATVARRDDIIRTERQENERLRGLRQQDADYIVTLRRQVEGCGQTPAPYPGLDR